MKIKSGDSYYLRQDLVIKETPTASVLLNAGTVLKQKQRLPVKDGIAYLFSTPIAGLCVLVKDKNLDAVVTDFIGEAEATVVREEQKKNAPRS